MSTAVLLEQIHALPLDERESLFDALWAESRDAWLCRLREDAEDIRASDAALAAWDGQSAPRLEDLMKLWGDAV